MKGIVVGGGISGASIAYNLAKKGVDVTLMEKKWPGVGSTGRGAGGIRSQWTNKADIMLAKKSVAILKNLQGELDFNILFRQGGYLIMAFDEDNAETLTKAAALQQSFSIDTQILDAGEVKEAFPYLNTAGMVAATFTKDDGVCHPYALLFGYLHAFKRLGGTVAKFTEARSVKVTGGKAVGVVTESGEVDSDFVVIAAGADSKDIAGTAKVKIPTFTRRQEILATESLKFFMKPMLLSLPSALYANQSLRGEVIGGIEEPDGKGSRNVRSTFSFLKKFSQEATQLIPTLRYVTILRPWAGLQDYTPDGEPIYGPTGVENLYVACGGGRKGFTFAPAVGKLMAEIIVNGRTSIDISPFALKRFEV